MQGPYPEDECRGIPVGVFRLVFKFQTAVQIARAFSRSLKLNKGGERASVVRTVKTASQEKEEEEEEDNQPGSRRPLRRAHGDGRRRRGSEGGEHTRTGLWNEKWDKTSDRFKKE